MVIECADKTSVPAGAALAVDRDKFAGAITENLSLATISNSFAKKSVLSI